MSPIVPLRFRITRIVDYAKGLSKLTDNDLLEKAKAIRWEMRSGVSSRARQDECLSLAIEACRRTMGIFHFPVQILGALNLLNGRVIEMQTGEGKTATAVLPAAVRAMVGRGCHVVTSNDYLAKRDAGGKKRCQVSLIASHLSPAGFSRWHARNAFVRQVKSSTFSIEQSLG